MRHGMELESPSDRLQEVKNYHYDLKMIIIHKAIHKEKQECIVYNDYIQLYT